VREAALSHLLFLFNLLALLLKTPTTRPKCQDTQQVVNPGFDRVTTVAFDEYRVSE